MNATTITGIEQGRAKFAYECANQVLTLRDTEQVNTAHVIQKAFEKKFDKKTREEAFLDFMKDPPKYVQEYRIKNQGNGKRDKKTLADEIVAFYEKYGKEYKSHIKKIPMLIKTNGLGATFAFVFSKADEKSPYTLIYHQTKAWLNHEPKGLVRLSNDAELAQEFVQRDSAEYRAITVEVLAFFTWLKRFAEGLIEGEADE